MNQQDLNELTENWHSDTTYINNKVDEMLKASQDHAYELGLKRGRNENQGWKPIETAPKDGTSFDIWVKSTKNPDYGVRMTGVCFSGSVIWGRCVPNSSFGQYASHWMPLPQPPKEQP